MSYLGKLQNNHRIKLMNNIKNIFNLAIIKKLQKLLIVSETDLQFYFRENGIVKDIFGNNFFVEITIDKTRTIYRQQIKYYDEIEHKTQFCVIDPHTIPVFVTRWLTNDDYISVYGSKKPKNCSKVRIWVTLQDDIFMVKEWVK
jgi:hypothetical protein